MLEEYESCGSENELYYSEESSDFNDDDIQQNSAQISYHSNYGILKYGI